MLTFLFWLLVWCGSGLLANLLKIYVLFRGPTHMITMYLSHPNTRLSGLLYLSMAKKYNPNAMLLHIVVTSSLVSAILSPLAIIDLFLDTIRFFNYQPPKQENTNEQN
jgi:hypothetical protein